MPFEDGGACVVGETPKTDGLVVAAGGENGTVGRAREGIDIVGVLFEDGGEFVVGEGLV